MQSVSTQAETVEQVLREPLRIHRLAGSERRVLNLLDEVRLMQAGRILESLSAEQIRHNQAEALYSRTFLAASQAL